MQSAEARELGRLQAGDHAEDARLFGVFQLGLKADHIVERAQLVVLAQLDHRMRAISSARVAQAHRLHRPEAQGFGAAGRCHLDRQAALEIGRVLFPILELALLALEKCRHEGLVLVPIQRAIDIVRPVPLVVARLEPGHLKIDAVLVNNRRDGIEKGQLVFAGERRDGLRKGRRSQRPGGDDDAPPVLWRQASHFTPLDGHQGMVFEGLGDAPRKIVAVDRQRRAGRHLRRIAGRHDQGIEPSHFLVQKANRVVLMIVGAKGIRTHQLGQAGGLVRCGAALGPHLVEDRRLTSLGDLPGGLGAGQTAADYMNDIVLCHAALHRRGG